MRCVILVVKTATHPAPRTSASCKVHSYAHISEFFHRLLEARRSHIINVSHDGAVDDEGVGGLVNLQLHFFGVQLKWNHKHMKIRTYYSGILSMMDVYGEEIKSLTWLVLPETTACICNVRKYHSG